MGTFKVYVLANCRVPVFLHNEGTDGILEGSEIPGGVALPYITDGGVPTEPQKCTPKLNQIIVIPMPEIIDQMFKINQMLL